MAWCCCTGGQLVVSEKVSWRLLLTTASLAPQALHAGVYVSQASLLQLSIEQSICLLIDERTGAGSITRRRHRPTRSQGGRVKVLSERGPSGMKQLVPPDSVHMKAEFKVHSR